MSEGMVITTAGRNLLALAMTGKELKFTRGYVGDGALGSRDIYALTGLISPKKELPIQSVRTSSTGTCEVVLEMDNRDMTSGFWLREYGLYARDPDNGREVLYAYTNKGEKSGYLEAYSGDYLVSYTLSLLTVIDQAPNVTAIINTQNNYVTISRLDARVQDLFAGSGEIAGLWTYSPGDEKRLRPSRWEDVKLAMLGVTDIASMNSRLERLEDTMNQTLLELEMRDIYPGYSHYLIEDFDNPDQCDMFKCKVTSIVAGDDSIDCDPIEGMLPGSLYTVADGVHAEQVQVESINIENGIQRIILKDVIKNVYILENTMLFRSGADIESGYAGSQVDTKSLVWEPGVVWSGLSTDSEGTISLDLSASALKGISLEGNAVLSSTRQITLSA